MIIRDMMTRATSTCGMNTPLAEVAHLMWQHDCGAIPILDEADHVVAMITDRDICMAGCSQDRPLSQIPAHNAASREVATVQENQSVEMARALMARYQVRRLPVVDGQQRLVGIVSINDLAKCASDASNGISPEHVTQTLAAIGKPHPAASVSARS